MFKIIKSQQQLTDYEMQLLVNLHRSHLNRMGKSEKEKHDFTNVTSVYRDFKTNSFIVKYKNKEWYHYCLNGEIY